MNSETELKYEQTEKRLPSANEREPRQGRKPWVKPVVSQAPINEVTAAGAGGLTFDGVSYS
jgi:hypothetical protein